jgi:hypothetical protein
MHLVQELEHQKGRHLVQGLEHQKNHLMKVVLQLQIHRTMVLEQENYRIILP